MALLEYAKSELNRIGMSEDSPDDMNKAMYEHIIKMVEEFSKEGHSGYSAAYAISLLSKLLKYNPITPLTGDDSEWMEIADQPDTGIIYQNKRHSAVFKDNTGSYDIGGKVFWEWYTDPESGETFKTYFTNRDSRVYITFPYVVPDIPIYEERIS